jgi:RNA polymerase sigma-70 factor, ECF subfamily
LAIARSLDLLRLRCRQRNRLSPDVTPDQAISQGPSPSSCAEASELAARLRIALGQLPCRQAEVFCMLYFEQMTSEEVAERLGLSPTATRMLLSRARRRLHGLLEPLQGAAKRDD